MNCSNILLLSHGQEPFCTDRVAGALSAHGFMPQRLDTETFPSTLTLAGELGPRARPRVLLDGRELVVAAVWLWRLWSPTFEAGVDPVHREAAMRESMTTLRGLLDLLAHVPWIDAIDLNRCAENKTRQLRLAHELRLTIPPTLITADPTAARRFFHAHAGRVIAKLQAPLAQSMAGGAGLPTRLLHAGDLDALDGLRACPMMFQRYVEKAYELRIAWVDGHAFVGALDGRKCGVDWRYESTASWEPHVLPDAVCDRLARLMARLGLRQGAIDMIVEPDGDYVFLEVNPHGEWGMLERDLELPIGEAIAAALIRLASQCNDSDSSTHIQN
jgi:glutathione synthase/RimK-type ligase-like ATP-grasp enzyme